MAPANINNRNVFDGSQEGEQPRRARKKMSAAARKRISEKQTAKWAERKKREAQGLSGETETFVQTGENRPFSYAHEVERLEQQLRDIDALAKQREAIEQQLQGLRMAAEAQTILESTAAEIRQTLSRPLTQAAG